MASVNTVSQGKELAEKRPAEESPLALPKRVMADRSKMVKETDVGILQHVNPARQAGHGFSGVIKLRYSDFQVFEVDQDGHVTHLTDEGIDLGKSKKDRRHERREEEREKEAAPEKAEDVVEATKEEPAAPKVTVSDTNKERLLLLISEAEYQQILDLFSNGGNMETTTVFDDKATRTKLHQYLREAFEGKLETITSPSNTFKIVLAKGLGRRKNNHVNHVDTGGVLNYGLGPYKNYLHFTVYKENRETMEVASTITKFLRVHHKSVKYAGTKDRRGVTCQRFSIQKANVTRVAALNKGLKGAILGGFAYADRSLDLGDLLGNEFCIAIRDVKNLSENKTLEEIVQQSFDSLSKHGFINYFGLQRFGTFSVLTHVLGIFLLRGDWKGAVDLLLAEQDIVAPDLVESRRVWASTKDAAAAVKLMPRRCSAEYAILSHLASVKPKKLAPESDSVAADDENESALGYSNNDYFRAIMQIPRNLRLIYVHAYQSYVWNLVASRRYELFGTEIQVGDLVMVQRKNTDTKVVTEIVDGEEFAEDVAGTLSDQVKALSEEDVKSGQYTIYDIVLPTPGFDVMYPGNDELMKVYVQAMAKDGLDPHDMGRRVKEFSLSGSYRPLMGRAQDLSYNIVTYKEDTDALLHTDLEILRAKREGQELSRITGSLGDKTAVILNMKLGVSSYATMALREFMEPETESK